LQTKLVWRKRARDGTSKILKIIRQIEKIARGEARIVFSVVFGTARTPVGRTERERKSKIRELKKTTAGIIF
jgi:adenine-specific DNA methylase